MGNIKKQRKKYNIPFKKWDKTRADEEDLIAGEFGLKNKTEVWKANAKVSKFRNVARTLFTQTGTVAERTKADVVTKAKRLGLVSTESATLDDLLGINARNVLDRRLQTVILKKGFAGSQKQARQFIAHGHIMIGDRVVTVPGYIVPKEEEALVTIVPKSPLSKEDHPARQTPQKKEEARLLAKLKADKAAEVEADPIVDEKDVSALETGGEEE